jgi:hypothetical protein
MPLSFLLKQFNQGGESNQKMFVVPRAVNDAMNFDSRFFDFVKYKILADDQHAITSVTQFIIIRHFASKRGEFKSQ